MIGTTKLQPGAPVAQPVTQPVGRSKAEARPSSSGDPTIIGQQDLASIHNSSPPLPLKEVLAKLKEILDDLDNPNNLNALFKGVNKNLGAQLEFFKQLISSLIKGDLFDTITLQSFAIPEDNEPNSEDNDMSILRAFMIMHEDASAHGPISRDSIQGLNKYFGSSCPICRRLIEEWISFRDYLGNLERLVKLESDSAVFEKKPNENNELVKLIKLIKQLRLQCDVLIVPRPNEATESYRWRQPNPLDVIEAIIHTLIVVGTLYGDDNILSEEAVGASLLILSSITKLSVGFCRPSEAVDFLIRGILAEGIILGSLIASIFFRGDEDTKTMMGVYGASRYALLFCLLVDSCYN